MIELRETNSMGWGVFALKEIKVGQIIARNAADSFYHADWPGIKQCKFGPYVFMDKDKYEQGVMSGFIAWGLITKVNHHDEPNAWIETTRENGHLEAILRASRTIYKDEQIFHKYTNRDDPTLYPWWDSRDT